MPHELVAPWSPGILPAGSACRACGAPAAEVVLELGPLACPGGGAAPLRVLACSDCRLVQLEAERTPGPALATAPEPRWRDRDVEALVAWLGLGRGNEVIEIGSGEGGALLPFLRRGIAVLGVEPMAELAQRAAANGVPTWLGGFDGALARRLNAAGHAPCFISAPRVLVESSDLNDALAGLRLLLAPGGVLALEMTHLLPIVRQLRFDAFRHGRLCYHTLATVEVALAPHGLAVFDVEVRSGGVLRLFARHVEDRGKPVTDAVEALRRREADARLASQATLQDFAEDVATATAALRDFLREARRTGCRVVGHGAPGHGDTLLAHAGIGPDLLPFVAETDPRRHGAHLPGTRIPIRPPSAIAAARPDVVLVLAPDHASAIRRDLSAIRGWGGRVALPGRRIEIFRGA